MLPHLVGNIGLMRRNPMSLFSMFIPWPRRITAAALLLPLVVACPTRPLETPCHKPTQQTTRSFAQSLEKDIDILFVIDNSPSMALEQVNLAQQFPKLIDAL